MGHLPNIINFHSSDMAILPHNKHRQISIDLLNSNSAFRCRCLLECNVDQPIPPPIRVLTVLCTQFYFPIFKPHRTIITLKSEWKFIICLFRFASIRN